MAEAHGEAAELKFQPNTDMSDQPTHNRITISLPPVVIQSLSRQAQPLAMTAGEIVKHLLTAAYTQPEGVHLNLEPVRPAEDPSQTHLPLGDPTGGQG